jgi:hypothetical protein
MLGGVSLNDHNSYTAVHVFKCLDAKSPLGLPVYGAPETGGPFHG